MKVQGSMDQDGRTLTIRIPLAFHKRGSRKQIVVPDGPVYAPRQRSPETALVKALARAHRWKRMLEGGEYASVAELAAAEKINQSYLCRVLRLTLLAPDIVESILDGRQGAELLLDELFKPFPNEWDRQRETFCRP
jgi:hypothetical protein